MLSSLSPLASWLAWLALARGLGEVGLPAALTVWWCVRVYG